MENQKQIDADYLLQGQGEIWQHIYSSVKSMALNCAVELGIADIIASHNCPITLSQIANDIGSPSLDIHCLTRIMNFLVHMKLFDAISPQLDGRETLYGLTNSSRWLLRDAELSLAPLVLMRNHPLLTAPLHFLSQCVTQGGTAFHKAHGRDMWDFASVNSEFNKIFNSGMECTAKITTKAVISEYRDGFGCFGSLVDVGGGTGAAIAEIVKTYPHIKGTNFDLPHVVATAPIHPVVAHIGGDMFKAIPKADAIFMKWIMHDWSDEDCIKILKNCRRAIPKETGKVIIVDIVLQAEGDGQFDKTGMAFDIVMLAHFSSGKERTEAEWKRVLEGGGFGRYKIIKIPALQSIIEAYPE
ncbi:xanthohumol 4-O-methyltransferase-like [Cornus florida]|uniref:xanthohumol 4-O-methyltransferase-like n=1 Tax=Cornus florida TaxID=4283 RepID=UPI00289A41A8|nr:xanthohumol 4-O-methyltransferase-like [Cornus florida]